MLLKISRGVLRTEFTVYSYKDQIMWGGSNCTLFKKEKSLRANTTKEAFCCDRSTNYTCPIILDSKVFTLIYCNSG